MELKNLLISLAHEGRFGSSKQPVPLRSDTHSEKHVTDVTSQLANTGIPIGIDRADLEIAQSFVGGAPSDR